MEEIKSFPTKEEIVEYFKENGLVECNLNYVAFAILREALEELGYTISASNEDPNYGSVDIDGFDLNFWSYIWKDNKYTNYVICGSFYYGDMNIKQDE